MVKAVTQRTWALPLRSDGNRYSKPPITPPTAIARSVNSSTQITVQASGGASSLGSSAGYRYRRNGALLNDSPTASPYVDSQRTANTTYDYAATLVDSAGNESGLSAVFQATTPASTDTIPPTTAEIQATALSASSLRIALVTPATDAGVGFRDYTLQWSISSSGPWNDLQAAFQAASFPITHAGLTPSTQRHYRLIAFDQVGNQSVSAVVSATTNPSIIGDGNHNYGQVTHICDPTATGSGTGSEASPWTLTQARAFNPNGQHCHIEFLPRAVQVALTNADRRIPNCRPQFGGTEQNPLIWSARNKAFNTADPNARTRFLPASGAGSMLGFGGPDYNYADGRGHFVLDGLEATENLNVTEGEVYNLVIRGARNVKFVRGRLGWGNGPTIFNCGSFFSQNASALKVLDTIFEKNSGSSGANGSHTEHYATTDLEIAYCAFRESGAGGINLKGEGPPGLKGARIHHNIFDRNDAMCVHFFAYDAPTSFNEAHWVYQNLMLPSATRRAVVLYRSLGNLAPRYAYVVNNTMLGPISNGDGDSGALQYFQHFNQGMGQNLVWRNNLIWNFVRGISGVDGAGFGPHNGSFDLDRNFWDTVATIMRESGANRTLQNVRDLFGEELNSVQGTAGMVNPAGGDYTLSQNAAARSVGRDILNLLGAGTTGVIPCGAHIQAFGQPATHFGPR